MSPGLYFDQLMLRSILVQGDALGGAGVIGAYLGKSCLNSLETDWT